MGNKTIKVKYVGFWTGFDPTKVVFTNMILENYNVIECDDPDYIICSVFNHNGEDYYDYCKYDQVRIMYSGENYIPNFNFVDYAVSSYPIAFQDRHFRYPLCFDNYNERFHSLLIKKRDYSIDILESKPFFANFIASHESESGLRGEFFSLLNNYKRVESFGSYLNNQPNSETVSITSKSEVQRKCKFTLCFESTRHEGFITEKITDAFFADTIPIYYGSKDVLDIFNEEAFIFCEDKNDFDRVMKKIIELDNNDELYLSMLKKPIFKDLEYVQNIEKKLLCFIKHIFDQPLEQAYRRSRVYSPRAHEQNILNLKEIKQALLSGRSIPIISDKQLIRVFIRRIIRSIKQMKKD